MSDQHAVGPLAGRRIALPETREIEQLARMLEQQGAEAIRCPMVAIKDAPDSEPVRQWLLRLPFDDVILFTGEGVRRLHGFARRLDLETAFRGGLAAARKITRGPKPERALRELGLKSDLRAAEPTTDGLIETLSADDLRGRRVGVQLYPGNPNIKFIDFLRQAEAKPHTVLPYVYVPAATTIGSSS
jgi:uroporphyrinogen-III synthase